MIKLKLNLISNFKPINKNSKLNNNFLKKKILCKNFIIFILFLNFFKFNNIIIFIKPIFKKKFNILNAPYRYKLSKSNFFFCRFNILLVLKINFNIFFLNNLNDILKVIKNLFFFFSKLNINLCHQDSFKIFLTSKYINNFLLKNYK